MFIFTMLPLQPILRHMTHQDPSLQTNTTSSDPFAHLSRPSATRLDLDADFYQRTSRAVVNCCGYEVGTPDYHSVVDMLNTRLDLNLATVDRFAFSLMLTGLSNSRRFAGEIHIDPVQGENSAAHSCHAVVLANEIFRRSGLLSPERASAETDELRRSISIGCLVHDMGEILGELSSLAQRNTNHAIEELPNIEREIFRITLTEAYRAASSEPCDSATFYAFVRNFRHRAGLSTDGIAGTSPQNVSEVLQEFSRQQETYPIAAPIQAAIHTVLALYDMAELKTSVSDSHALFIGNAVKVVEHLQGLRHFMRFAKCAPDRERPQLFSPETHVDQSNELPRPVPSQGVIPIHYVSSRRYLNNVKYIEKELPYLFSYSSSAEDQALAGSLRDAAYQTQIEWFNISRNYIDRTPTVELPHLVKLQSKLFKADAHVERMNILNDLEELLKLQLDKDREQFRRAYATATEDPTYISELLPCESRLRITLLYAEALRRGFEPTTETPLMLLAEVPAELRGFLAGNKHMPSQPCLKG